MIKHKTAQTPMPDKRRPQVFSFQWGKDSAGYGLTKDGLTIARNGGKLIAIAPESFEPPIHHQFAMLSAQVVAPGEHDPNEPPPVYGDNSLPFWEQHFPNYESALLSFTNHYGLLGLEGRGSSANSEPLGRIAEEQQKFALFFAAGLDTGAEVSPEMFNRFLDPQGGFAQAWGSAPVGPDTTVRLERDARGRTQLKVVPRSLIAWLWLQVAQDCVNGIRWDGPGCENCEKPMPRGPGAHRIDAKFCSNKCRTYFNRNEAKKTSSKPKPKRRKP